MKICVLAAGFLLIASCALAADIDGKWSGQYNSGMGEPMTLTYTFKADGNKLTGTSLGGPDQQIPIKDGKIDGNKISFAVDVDMNGMAMKFKYKGVLSGEELKLTFDMEMPGMDGGGMGGPGGGGPGGPGGGGPGGAPKPEIVCKKVK
jgi:hypothetical protein